MVMWCGPRPPHILYITQWNSRDQWDSNSPNARGRPPLDSLTTSTKKWSIDAKNCGFIHAITCQQIVTGAVVNKPRAHIQMLVQQNAKVGGWWGWNP